MENEARRAAGHSLLAAPRGRRGVLAGELRLGRQRRLPSPLHLIAQGPAAKQPFNEGPICNTCIFLESRLEITLRSYTLADYLLSWA